MERDTSVDSMACMDIDFHERYYAFRWGCLLMLSTIGSALGQTTAVEPTRLAQRFVNDKLTARPQRLRLEDWRISAVMALRSDLAPKTLRSDQVGQT